MKYLISYIFTTLILLIVYYMAFFMAAMASYLTNGLSTYVILVAAAGISGLIGPILLYLEKTK